ncbi:glucose-6-phosphate isomerase [Rhodococcus opacus]|uniref:glucose-6-phosphate isomerase n=1 Tax=Rhodococcus opacus TaxID=37919 RepID=UPI00247601F0|nr:glucose-6-phosphate isomerase [Rhodococcus opacus]
MDANATTTSLWEKLTDHQSTIVEADLRELFALDPNRGRDFTATAGDLYVDFSKHLVTRETLDLLVELARASGVEQSRDAMFVGMPINSTEGRAVLHTALRAPRDASLVVDGQDVINDVHNILDRMAGLAERIRSGLWRGATGKRIRTVVNIGIGGSDLGPAMTYRALRPYVDGPEVRFVSNIDPSDLTAALTGLDPSTTLFVVVSKTFSTVETLTNAAAARRWLTIPLGEDAVPRHFVAVSTDTERVDAFGIERENMLGFWDWVGGRYSVGSAVGLSLMIAVGPARFGEFLAGFRTMDDHFRSAPLESNAPVLMGLLGIWYASFFGADSHAVLPYSNDLARFPAYLQQLVMESNGKSVRSDGTVVHTQTGEIYWGEPGTNGQHAFHQLLHQGTRLVPVDFIGFANPPADGHSVDSDGSMSEVLIANMFAQAKVLAFGRSGSDIAAEGVCRKLIPHKIMSGNRPSTTILAPRLTPSTLGQLIALYEHVTFVQGVVWGINSFDQWGVELGKKAALELVPALRKIVTPCTDDDTSTMELTTIYRQMKALPR